MEMPSCWSELPFDLMECIFQRMSFVDFQRAKLVCSKWYLASKRRVIKKKGSPWLMLFPEKSNCVLYNPEANEIYNPLIDYSGFRFLANSGKWFLVVTPQCNLCIIDLFSSERIDLPPIESLVTLHKDAPQRVGDKGFQFVPQFASRKRNRRYFTYDVDTLRGLLWVDEKNKANYAVIWYFCIPNSHYSSVGFCKNGYDKCVALPVFELLLKCLRRSRLLLLRGYKLYIHTAHSCVTIVDLSDEIYITRYKTSPLRPNRWCRPTRHLTVTFSEEVLVVVGIKRYSDDPPKISKFKIYKDDPAIEVESLGRDEALLIDLGITTSVKDVPGIEPNCIYFSSHNNLVRSEECKVDICVFNLAMKTLKRFPNLSGMPLKDARWFIPTLG